MAALATFESGSSSEMALVRALTTAGRFTRPSSFTSIRVRYLIAILRYLARGSSNWAARPGIAASPIASSAMGKP